MDVERTPQGEDLLTRGDLARWSGLPERHPLVGLFHRFGGFRRMNEAFGQLSHLQGADFTGRLGGEEAEEWWRTGSSGLSQAVERSVTHNTSAMFAIREDAQRRPLR